MSLKAFLQTQSTESAFKDFVLKNFNQLSEKETYELIEKISTYGYHNEFNISLDINTLYALYKDEINDLISTATVCLDMPIDELIKGFDKNDMLIQEENNKKSVINFAIECVVSEIYEEISHLIDNKTINFIDCEAN